MLRSAVLVLAIAAGLASLAPGDVVSKDGRFKAATIEGANLTKLNRVLDAMEQLGKDEGNKEVEDCAKCLREMLKHHRICLETGTHNSAMSAWSGKQGGKCGDAKDGIHINPKTFQNYNDKTFMSILAHEWKHLMQSSCDPRPQREVEGYTCGKNLLALCGITSGGLVDWYDKKIAAWQAKVDTGKGGAKSASDSDFPATQYDVFGNETNLWVGTPEQPIQAFLPLQRFDNGNFYEPSDLFLIESPFLPQGSDLAIVLGFDAGDNAGVIQFYDINFGNLQAQLLQEHVLSGIDPLSGYLHIDQNPDLNRLYVLDTIQDQVLQLVPQQGDPVGAPFQLNPFPYLAPGADPKLATAQEIGPGEQPNAIRLYDGDGRADDLGVYTEPIIEAIDANGDGQADQILAIEQHTQIRLLPALDKNPPEDGDELVTIGGTPGATIEVRATNEDGTQILEVFGQTQPGNDYLVDFPLPRELQLGEFVQVADLGDPDFPQDLPPYEVVPCGADLDGDGDSDANDFFLYLDLFSIGDPGADIDGDGDVDSNDFFAYLDEFQRCTA